MNRRDRKRHPSIIKPVSSIYVSEEDRIALQPMTTLEEQVGGNSSSEFVRRERKDENDDDEEDRYDLQQEWEDAETDILDSLEFVAAATLVSSKEDRRSFVRALHVVPRQEPDPSSYSSSSSRVQPHRGVVDGSSDPEETPLLSNTDRKQETGTYLAATTRTSNVPMPHLPPPPPGPVSLVSSSSSSGSAIPPRRTGSVLTDISVSNRSKVASPIVDIWTGNPATRQYLISYWLYSLANVAQSEAFPLFAMASTGLKMGESSIGLVGTTAGLIYCIGQYFIFSTMMKHLTLLQSLRHGALW
jgi:hypothetical protein